MFFPHHDRVLGVIVKNSGGEEVLFFSFGSLYVESTNQEVYVINNYLTL